VIAISRAYGIGVERQSPGCTEQVEQRALKIIGITLLALATLVGVDSIRSLLAGEQPDVSRTGIVLMVVTLIVMPVLAREKRRVGHELGARLVEADSQ
jgi:divalent metal cation (Fe/Co/Zn/Cd) transporter